MRVVVDTNALIFALIGSPRLTRQAAGILGDTSCDLIVSSASFFEVALKHRRGRLPLSAEDLRRGVAASGLQISAPNPGIMIGAAQLDWNERDPWDRIIAATAIALAEGSVVTADPAFDGVAGVTRIW